MASALSKEQFSCIICLDIFNNPVSIPCGHNFCLRCIKRFWDTKHKSECPLCKENFKNRPELRINVGLKDITEQFKRSLKDRPGYVSGHLCENHNEYLEKFCKRDQKPVCVKCAEWDHRNHEIVPLEKESKRIMTQMKKTEAEFQRMIQARITKIEEVKVSMKLSNENKETELQKSIELVTMVISALKANQALLIEELEQKQKAADRTARQYVKELGQEINELQRRRGELQLLKHSEDPLHLIQSFPSLSAPLSNRDWSEVRVQSENYIGTVRRASSKLVNICHEVEKKLSAEEAIKTNQYAVDVTLDPATASGWLILSPDGKKVSLGSQQKKPTVPDDPRRFDSCVSILGKQSFISGRHYWVVQVGDKTDWDLGVAKESINRKGAITVRPDSGYWAICRRKGGSLSACAGPSVTLNLQEIPQKVGVFLDCEEGSVSFYDAEAKTHIYTYSGCNFTEPLYPYLNPCLHDNGKNTAPLIICPVEVGLADEIASF